MPSSPTSALRDRPESPDERMQRRRARRWNRRLRMAGPFVGIVLLLATLALCVDLIEYDPQLEADRLTTRPIPQAIRDKGSAFPGGFRSPGVSSTSVVEDGRVTIPTTPDLSTGIDDDPDVVADSERSRQAVTDRPSPSR